MDPPGGVSCNGRASLSGCGIQEDYVEVICSREAQGAVTVIVDVTVIVIVHVHVIDPLRIPR
jgi:hypothetical protein